MTPSSYIRTRSGAFAQKLFGQSCIAQDERVSYFRSRFQISNFKLVFEIVRIFAQFSSRNLVTQNALIRVRKRPLEQLDKPESDKLKVLKRVVFCFGFCNPKTFESDRSSLNSFAAYKLGNQSLTSCQSQVATRCATGIVGKFMRC